MFAVIAAAIVMSLPVYADKVKVGFVYVGPTGDHGWTYRHDIGRQDVEAHFGDQVETFYVESVSEGPDAERVINSMVLKGADIIFTTSFGYMEATLKMANRYPNVKFEHATGYKQAAKGCDMVAQHTDSPAPMQAAEQQGKHGFGQASDQIAFAPDAQLTATIDNWSPYYIRKVGGVIDGTWKSEDYFGHMNEGVVMMAPFTNMPDDVRTKAADIMQQISDGNYFAFTGPIKDQNGEIRIPEGKIATDVELNTMDYYVEGITARFPS